jgi:hypothetical protein
MLVAEIKDQGLDAAGVRIIEVYTKKPPHSAIYRTKQRVMVHYADDDAEAKQQAALLASLSQSRGEINGLIDGWRLSQKDQGRVGGYERRVADALEVALQNDPANALKVLTDVKADINDERTSRARFEYLAAASLASLIVIVLVWVVTWSRPGMSDLAWMLWLSLAGGTVGAFFSIAIGIRGRTVLTDLHWRDNTADAVLRVVIGAIAAAILVSLVKLHVVNVMIGDATADGDVAKDWLYGLLVAVIAGFSERMIPDLLEKTATTAAGTPAPALRQGAGANPPPTGAPAVGVAAAISDAVVAQKAAEDGDQLQDCLCDHGVQPQEATSDTELPPATGGVAAPRVAAAPVP